MTAGARPGKGPGPSTGPGADPEAPERGPGWIGARGGARLAAVGLVVAGLLWPAFRLTLAAEPLFGVAMPALGVGVAVACGSERVHALRFVFPAVVAVLAFIALPVGHTSHLRFTDQGSANLPTRERATAVLLSRVEVDPATERPFAPAREGGAHRVLLPAEGEAPALLFEPSAMGPPWRSRPSRRRAPRPRRWRCARSCGCATRWGA